MHLLPAAAPLTSPTLGPPPPQGFIYGVTPLLHKRLAKQAGTLKGLVATAKVRDAASPQGARRWRPCTRGVGTAAGWAWTLGRASAWAPRLGRLGRPARPSAALTRAALGWPRRCTPSACSCGRPPGQVPAAAPPSATRTHATGAAPRSSLALYVPSPQASRESSASWRREREPSGSSKRSVSGVWSPPGEAADGQGPPSSSFESSPAPTELPRSGTSGRLASLGAHRLNTDAMLQVRAGKASRPYPSPHPRFRAARAAGAAWQGGQWRSGPQGSREVAGGAQRFAISWGGYPSLRADPAPPPPPVQVLQHDLRGKSRRSSLSTAAELVVGECLGKGGYGKVYKALWHKAVVAAKVMPVNAGEREVRWRAPGFKG
jgi:hypothetical protein